MAGRQDQGTGAVRRRTALTGFAAATAFAGWPGRGAIGQPASAPTDTAVPLTPAMAYATHDARAMEIARTFAATDLRSELTQYTGKQPAEDSTTALIAHCHALTADPAFTRPGSEPSRSAVPKLLLSLQRGEGLMGTPTALHKMTNYDAALRGLMVLLLRYPTQIGPEGVRKIEQDLIPPDLGGGHPDSIEVVELLGRGVLSVLTGNALSVPETENHLLMIESSRFLVNQVRQKAGPGNVRFDNGANGLRDWLLGRMALLAQHDFLEFNARPYARYSLHALLNLHEFSSDPLITTASQHVLDYVMMKFAVSSSRGRRVAPFRRQQYRINHQDNSRDDLLVEGSDEVAGMFLAYTGATGPDGHVLAQFPRGKLYEAVLAGTAAFRPTPAAYIVALDRTVPAGVHRFFHGTRPVLPASGDLAESGLEIYAKSPSFMITAGGSFLDSGYGSDEIGAPVFSLYAWEQTSRAQATTLIPTRLDSAFHDLLRFEPYPDPLVSPTAGAVNDISEDGSTMSHTSSVNTGVAAGLMAGANLRPSEKSTVTSRPVRTSQAMAAFGGSLYVGWLNWKDRGTLDIARVRLTSMEGLNGSDWIDGVGGIEPMTSIAIRDDKDDSRDDPPALVAFAGKLVATWTDAHTDNLHLGLYDPDARKMLATVRLGDTSKHGPALVAHKDQLLLGWTGTGDGKLNIAHVLVDPAGPTLRLDRSHFLADSSEGTPSLASLDGRLYLAWQGRGEHKLNVMLSEDDGATFTGKQTYEPEASSHGPSLVAHNGSLWLAWKGDDNSKLTVMRVVVLRNTQGKTSLGDAANRVVLGERSDSAPTLCSFNGTLVLSWRGTGDEFLNLRISPDGTFQPWSGWRTVDRSDVGFFLAVYRTAAGSAPAGKGAPLDNLGIVYAAEADDLVQRSMDFAAFARTVRAQNAGLPAQLVYGSTVPFAAPDGKRYSIWFNNEGDKYRARVTEAPGGIVDFTTLGLVSGPYMTAPGRHDGLVEIRHPGCEAAPVVLDFRNPQRPQRDDAKAKCPQPWLDRADALFATSARLSSLGRLTEARLAQKQGMALRAEMASLVPPVSPTSPAAPPGSPSVIVQRLAAIGIDYSVTKAEMEGDWLRDPYTPYPSVAQVLLNAGWRFAQPIYLDVIVGFYEKTRGVASPRRVEDVRMDVLRASVLAAFNERYTKAVRDFNALLRP